MDTIQAILILAAIFVVGLIIQKLKQGAVRGISRAIQPGKHQQGQEAAGTTTTFRSSTLTGQQLLDAMWKELPYAEGDAQSLVRLDVVKQRTSERGFVLKGAKKLATSFIISVTANAREVVADVAQATMSDGIVAYITDLRGAQAELEHAARGVDPAVSVESSVAKVTWK